MLSDDAQDILALYGVPGVGAKTHARLIGRFGSAAGVFAASPEELGGLDGIGEKTIASIRGFNRRGFVDRQKRLMDACGAKLLVRGEDDYPAQLAAFRSAPPVLFVRGDVSVLSQPGAAFVGTRRPTAYGLRMTRELVAGSVAAGLSVISGMAAGVDTAAHRTAIEHDGVTVAVFGCGVDTVYPVENRGLAADIEKTGCLVSHFPMGVPAIAGNFPARNAVVVGLSRGTVVIEAPGKSGALITAELTLKAGRHLMTVPGNADSPASAGANSLLAYGAHLVCTAADVVKVLGMPASSVTVSTGTTQTSVQKQTPVPNLPGLQGELLDILSGGALQIEDIGLKTGNPIAELLTELTLLEMDGYIRQLPGKVFERC